MHASCTLCAKQAPMNFNFIRNVHFTKHLKTADRVREFNFRILPGTSNSAMHVDVPDDRGNRIVFRMSRHEGPQWRIDQQPLPGWILDNEKKLSDLIEEELK